MIIELQSWFQAPEILKEKSKLFLKRLDNTLCFYKFYLILIKYLGSSYT